MNSDSLAPTKIIPYGSFLSVVLSKKSHPGDGLLGRGTKG